MNPKQIELPFAAFAPPWDALHKVAEAMYHLYLLRLACRRDDTQEVNKHGRLS